MSGNGDAACAAPQRGAAPPFRTVLLWFRRDLRVSDNPALIAAVQAATSVVRAPSIAGITGLLSEQNAEMMQLFCSASLQITKR